MRNVPREVRLFTSWGAKPAPAPGVLGNPQPEPPGLRTYVVRRGDTFFGIARRFRSPARLILAQNPAARRRMWNGREILDLHEKQAITVPMVQVPLGFAWDQDSASFVRVGRGVGAPPPSGLGDYQLFCVTASNGTHCTTDDGNTGECIGAYCQRTYVGPVKTGKQPDCTQDLDCSVGAKCSNGSCVPVVAVNPPTDAETKSCSDSGGTPHTSGGGGGWWCDCGPDRTYDGTTCVSTTAPPPDPPPPVVCGPGTTDDGNNGCRPVVASDCDPGDTFDPNGKGGYHCFGPCPGKGSVYDMSLHDCVCPQGTGWNDAAGACVQGATPKPPPQQTPPCDPGKTRTAVELEQDGVTYAAGACVPKPRDEAPAPEKSNTALIIALALAGTAGAVGIGYALNKNKKKRAS